MASGRNRDGRQRLGREPGMPDREIGPQVNDLFERNPEQRLYSAVRALCDARGSEQRGARYAVVVQSDDLLLSTVLVAPTSKSAMTRIFRPTILVNDEKAQVLIEQTTAVALERLGELVGHVSRNELEQINDSLRLAFALD